MAKTWTEKRDCGREPHVKVLDKSFAGIREGCKMLISSPQEIDAFIREIPPGSIFDPKEIRHQLAQKHGADATCPMSTGIFLRIVAEAAIEEMRNGKPVSTVTPFWRCVTNESSIARKISIDLSELDSLRDLDV